MPLLVRTPRNPAVVRESGPYPRALNVGSRKRTTVQRKLGRNGLAGLDPATLATLLTLVQLRPRPVEFFDVGAHIGLHSALVSVIFGPSDVRAHAFEPTPDTLAECRNVSTQNGLGIRSTGIGLSDSDDTATLCLSDKADTSNSLTQGFRPSSEQIRVATRTLDSYCAEHGLAPDVLKIDVETHEAHTLRGALGTLAQSRPWVVCELLPRSPKKLLTPMLRQITELGYRLYPIDEFGGWQPYDADDYRRQLRSGVRNWLLAPEPLDEQFFGAFRAWLDAIAQCGPNTNVTVPPGAPLPDGWNTPYRMEPHEGAGAGSAQARNAFVRAPLPPPAALLDRLWWRLPYRVANWIEHRLFSRSTATDVAVTRVHGRLRRVLVRPDQVAAKAGEHNLDLAVQLCERAGLDYLVTSGSRLRSHRIAVEAADWSQFVAELTSTAARRPVYVQVPARSARGRNTRWAGPANHRNMAHALAEQDSLDVFEYLTTARGAEVMGPLHACRVERWARTDEDTLVAPDTHPLGKYVGRRYQQRAQVQLGGRALPTLEPFARTNITDLDFPVDVVYLWVDGADPAWLERKRQALALRGESDPTALSAARFRDNGELRYSLRSLEQYASWVRRVYLVTDDQIPEWLNVDHEHLRLVNHRELFDDAGTFPSFNSHALGARLHHLDGLAEHYLHLNDDFFFGRPVSPSLFFHSNGLSKFFLSRATLPWREREAVPPHEAARRNVVELLERDFGRTATRAFFHTPIPQRRSVMMELEKRYPDVFETTWSSQFRSRHDYEINSWLHHYYAYLTGQAVPGMIKYAYFSTIRAEDWKRMTRLLRARDRDVLCINDDDEITEHEEDTRVADWLEAYLPTPSSFER